MILSSSFRKWFAALIVVTTLSMVSVGSRMVPAESLKVVGPAEMVYNKSAEGCDEGDIPDIPARAFRDDKGRVQLIASNSVNRRMIGPDLNQVKHDCHVIMHSRQNRDSSKYEDQEWLHSFYTENGRQIFALIHNEYQGHTHEGQCRSKTYENCWFNSVTWAVSNDSGDSYTHPPGPQHLVATIPYRYEPDIGHPVGIFNPSNIVKKNGYYYVIVNGAAYKDIPDGAGLLRTNNLTDPKSWRAWDGKGFHVRFSNPYLETNASTATHYYSPLDLEIWVSSLTYNTHLNRYLALGSGTFNHISGIYYSLSEDLIHWTKPKLLKQGVLFQVWKKGNPDPIEYPSALDPNSLSRSFETTGKRFYIYFERFNWNRYPNDDQKVDLMRFPVEITGGSAKKSRPLKHLPAHR